LFWPWNSYREVVRKVGKEVNGNDAKYRLRFGLNGPIVEEEVAVPLFQTSIQGVGNRIPSVNMKSTLNILHIEDSEEDSDLIRELLLRDGLQCQITRVDTGLQVFDELEKNAYDLILADCRLPDFSGSVRKRRLNRFAMERPIMY